MDTAVYDKLKETLGDATVTLDGEEKKLFELVGYWEEGVEKTKAANKDLTAQREAWEKKEREYKSTVEQLNTAKSDIEKQIEDLKKTGTKNTGKEAELEQQINTLNDKIASMQSMYEDADKKAKEAEERAIRANESVAVRGLREKILSGLSKHKITGERADLAIEAIMAKGLAKLIKDEETGLHNESFCTVKDGKRLAADVDTMCEWFSKSNPYLVEGSGKPGTGKDHSSSSPPNSGGKQNYLSMIND